MQPCQELPQSRSLHPWKGSFWAGWHSSLTPAASLGDGRALSPPPLDLLSLVIGGSKFYITTVTALVLGRSLETGMTQEKGTCHVNHKKQKEAETWEWTR